MPIAGVKLLQRVLTPMCNIVHQHFVTSESTVRSVELEKRVWKYGHAFLSNVNVPQAIGLADYRSIGKTLIAFDLRTMDSAMLGPRRIGDLAPTAASRCDRIVFQSAPREGCLRYRAAGLHVTAFPPLPAGSQAQSLLSWS
jgi:hypothetical protein